MVDRIEIGNEEAIAWVETSLRYARSHNLSRLVGLLVAVRDEIAFETELVKSIPLIRRRTGAR